MESKGPECEQGWQEAAPGGDVHSRQAPSLPIYLRRWGRLSAGLLLMVALLGALPGPASSALKPRLKEAHPSCLAACHQTHRPINGTKAARLRTLEETCLGCHGGPPRPTVDLGASKLPLTGAVSRHGVPPEGKPAAPYRRVVHQTRKDLVLRHDCTGCHDVHAKQVGMPSQNAFDPRGQHLGIKPISTAQVCFGCHAGPEAASIPFQEPDLGALFATGSGSSHGLGRSAADRPDLPSLRNLAFKGKLDCTSCHDNPDPAGPRGPHASSYPYLLKAAYGREKDLTGTGERSNELCFTCHDRYSIESNRSFPLHREHISGFTGTNPARGKNSPSAAGPGNGLPLGFKVGRAGTVGGASSLFAGFGEPTPCATCHDPHGSLKNPKLIQFDPAVVTRSSYGGVDFFRTGLGHGSCTLTCHGYDHAQTRY